MASLVTSLVEEHLQKFSREELEKEFGTFRKEEEFEPNGDFSIKISESLHCTNECDSDLLCSVYESIERKWTGRQTDVSIGVGAWITTVRQALLCTVVSALGMKKKGFQYRGFTHNTQNPYALVVCDATMNHCVQFQCKIMEGNDRLTGIRLKEKINEDFDNISYGSVLLRQGGKKVAYAEIFKHRLSLQTGRKIKKKIGKKHVGRRCALPSCEEEGKLKCSRCKLVSYCSPECAKKRWGVHKKHCCPSLPKGESVSLVGYEDFYDEPLHTLKGEKTKMKLPIKALAYFDKLSGTDFSLQNLKKTVEGWRKVKTYKEVYEGHELVKNLEEELKIAETACQWFHEHYHKKAEALEIPREYTTKFYAE